VRVTFEAHCDLEENMLTKFWFLSFLTVFLVTIEPAESADSPERCVSIQPDSERLVCYDKYFRPNTPPTDVTVSAKQAAVRSPLEARRAEETELRDRWFAITPHRPNYIMPATYNVSPDYSIYGPAETLFADTEVKFQLSLKTALMIGLWRDSSISAAYTQQSYWQLYADEEVSAPFRETNHEPEIVWTLPVDFRLLGFRARLASFAFVHQSNGQARPLSRSWNRITGELIMERNRLVLSAKTWARVDDPSTDDNPNIKDYMGRIQLGAAYKGDRHTFAIGLKNSLDGNLRSGVEVNWMFPLTRRLKGFVQAYSGYGENLVDMENYNNRIGIGVALTDWL